MSAAMGHVAAVQHDSGHQGGAQFGAAQRSGKIDNDGFPLLTAVGAGKNGMRGFAQ